MKPTLFSSPFLMLGRGIAVAVMLCLMSVPSAFAQQENGVSVSPLMSDVQLMAGEDHELILRVRNLSSTKTHTVSLESQDIEIGVDNQVNFLDLVSKQNVPRSAASWIQFAGEESFSVPPGEFADVEIVLAIPENVQPGDYYASVNVFHQPNRLAASSLDYGVTIRQSMSSLVFVQVGEDGVEVRSDQAQASSPYVIGAVDIGRDGDQMRVSVPVSNDTLRYVKMVAVVSILDENEQVIFRQDGKPERIFPGQSEMVGHEFPRLFLEQGKGVKLRFAVMDSTFENTYFETEKDLESDLLLTQGPLFLDLRFWLVIAGVLVLVFLGRRSLRYRNK